MRNKLTRLILAVSLATAALVPLTATASDNPCDDNAVIFSRNRIALPGGRFVNSGSVNANALTCFADDSGDISGDNRYLAPGANQVLIRYVEDLGPDAVLVVVLNGLGFADYEDTLVYIPVDENTGLGGYSDSAAYIDIPAPGSGSISADVYIVEGTERTLLDSVHFRTLDQ